MITKLVKILLLPIIILIAYVVINNTGTNYGLVNSTAYTKKAFNITPNQLIDRFIEEDTRSVSQYGLLHTDWIPYDEDEEFFTSNYNTLYHGEHRYECYFYKSSKNQSEPKDLKDERVLYCLYVRTDDQNHIFYLELTTLFREETLASEKKLNGYFGTTLRGEIFSILSSQEGDFVLKKFKKAEDGGSNRYVEDNNVRYYYKGYSNAKEYAMYIPYNNK